MQRNLDSDVERVFNDAIELPEADRATYLSAACGGDGRLHSEVTSLLRAHSDARGFLESTGGEAREGGPPTEGMRIGPYQLRRLVGAGGMGSVWEGVRSDDCYSQRVAIKIVRPDMVTSLARARFWRERQTLAELSHPNITSLIDGGTTSDGLPYLVMEMVDGEPIDKYCDSRKLSIERRIDLFRDACAAVQYAHQRLIVHRDIKPENVLVTSDGRVKLIDFGISKALADATGMASATRMPFRALTPRYASPEQLRGETVTTASDVYSLGVLLHELLAGRMPESSEQPPSEALAASQAGSESAEPTAALRGVSVGRLRRLLRGDLDNIVMTATRFDAARRYGSVQQLSDDLGRYRCGFPVSAQRDSLRYRVSKFIRRHKAGVAISSAAVIALAGGLTLTAASLARARKAELVANGERSAALAAQRRAEEAGGFMRNIIADANPYRFGAAATVADLLAEARRRVESEFGGEPDVAAGIHYTLGESFSNLWRWKDTLHHSTIALRLAEATRGPDDPFVADCLVLHARALTWDRNELSVRMAERAVAIRKKCFGAADPRVAESTVVLGFACWHGVQPPDWERADRCYREALAIYEKALAGPDRRVAIARLSHGALLFSRRQNAEAERSMFAALAMFRAIPHPEDRYYWSCLSGCTQSLHRAQRWAEEEPLLRELIRITPRGDEPEEYSEALWRLGEIQAARSDFAAARQSYRDSLAWRFRLRARERPVLQPHVAEVEQLLAGNAGMATPLGYGGLMEVVASVGAESAQYWNSRLATLASATELAGDPVTAVQIRAAVRCE